MIKKKAEVRAPGRNGGFQQMATKKNGNARAVIRYNKDRAGIELVLPDGRRLTSEELGILKSVGFKWHKKSKYWYTVYSDEKLELIKSTFLGKEAQFPAVTEQKIIRQMAAERAAREAKKKESKPKTEKSSKTESSRMDALEQQMAQLAQMMEALVKQQASK